MTFNPADMIRVLPETVLTAFALLVMLLDPFLPEGKKGILGYHALAGVIVAGAATFATAANLGPAFGGLMAADHFSVYFTSLLLLVAGLTILGSIQYLERDHLSHGEFYALLLLATAGGCFMAGSTELIMIFIALEISSVASYVLAGYRRTENASNEAALKYFLLGSFATAFFLYGVAFVYGLTGSTRLTVISARLQDPDAHSTLLWVALIFMFVGLAFKVSIAPFQVWTPDVYEGAPAPVTAFLSVAPKAAAFAVLVRILLGAMTPAGDLVFWLLWVSAALTMTVGNLAAIWQSNVKRMLAYSAIAHAGYVMVGIAAAWQGDTAGASPVLFYLAAYALMNVGVFVLIAHLGGSGERYNSIDDYTGLAYHRPGVAAVLVVLLLSLAGFPTTAGFFAKFYVFRSAVHAHLIGLTVIAVLNSVASLYYYLRLLVAMYMREGETKASTAAVPWSLGLALAVSIVGIFYVGLFPNLLLAIARRASVPLP